MFVKNNEHFPALFYMHINKNYQTVATKKC